MERHINDEPFLHKRKAFRHEAEKRILIDDKRWNDMLGLNILGANWHIFETMQDMSDEERLKEIEERLCKYLGHINEKNISNNFYVEEIDLPKYIVGVKVNPFAEDWYVELIKGLCDEYKLNFLGRSQLYVYNEI